MTGRKGAVLAADAGLVPVAAAPGVSERSEATARRVSAAGRQAGHCRSAGRSFEHRQVARPSAAKAGVVVAAPMGPVSVASARTRRRPEHPARSASARPMRNTALRFGRSLHRAPDSRARCFPHRLGVVSFGADRSMPRERGRKWTAGPPMFDPADRRRRGREAGNIRPCGFRPLKFAGVNPRSAWLGRTGAMLPGRVVPETHAAAAGRRVS